MAERFHFHVEGERLTALVYRASKPIGATLLFGHGASGGQRDRFVREYATGLAERGVLVVTYDFPFIEHGRRSPDRDEVLRACCRAAIVAAWECRPKNHLFAGGKSLGGRVACEVVASGGAEVEDVAGIVVLGYPLHPPGKPTASRARLLGDVRLPMLVVQGSRDPFGTPEELEPLVTVHRVEGGDHSFVVAKRDPTAQAEVHAAIQDEVARWISELSSGAPRTTSVAPRVRGESARPYR